MKITGTMQCPISAGYFLFLLAFWSIGLEATDQQPASGNASSNGTGNTSDTTASPSTTTSTQPTPPPVRRLKAVTLLDPPFVQLTTRGDKHQGLAVDILNAALSKMKYDALDMAIHGQGLFGFEESPGQWNGLIGEVQNKTVDIALAAFTINSKRSTVVKFSQPFMHAGPRVLYKIPDSWHPREAMVTILRPFSPGLWFLLVFMFALTSAGLYIIGKYSPYEDTAFVGKAATYDGLTLANSLLYVFSSLVWQGYTSAPRSISGRVLTGFWWVFTLFTISSYIASLCVVLFRTNPEIRTLPFTTMEEMSRQNKVGIMVVQNSATFAYLNSSQGAVEKRILAVLNLHKSELLVESVQKGIDKMIQSDGKFALLMEGPIAEYLSTQEPCDKMVIGEPLGFHTYGFACRNDTDLCDQLSTQLLAMREDGSLSAMKEKWFHVGCLTNQPKSYIFEGLPFFDTFGGQPEAIVPLTITIQRFSSAFIILAIGLTLAGVFLGVEIFWAKRRGTAVPRKLGSHQVSGEDDLERIDNDFHDRT